MPTTPKDDLHDYLQQGREALLWKLEGVSDHDARRPLVPTGTNLLGLVKHVAGTEAAYLGVVFGRPFPEPLPWMAAEAEDNADMWPQAEESRADLVELYRRSGHTPTPRSRCFRSRRSGPSRGGTCTVKPPCTGC